MPNKEKYAIRCSTEEEARECREKWLEIMSRQWTSFIDGGMWYTKSTFGYTIITYAEARKKWLLGEVCKSCLGKKQLSTYKWVSVCSADFPWDKSYVVDKWGIKMVDCSRCNGTGLDPVFVPESVETSIWYIKENGGEIILDSEKQVDSGRINDLLDEHYKEENVVEKIMQEIDKYIPKELCIYDKELLIWNMDIILKENLSDKIIIERKTLEELIERYKLIIKLRESFPDDSNWYKSVTKTMIEFVEDLETLLHNK